MARYIATELVHGRTVAELEAWAQTYAGVTKADVLAAWKICRESTVFSLVGDEPTIAAVLKAQPGTPVVVQP